LPCQLLREITFPCAPDPSISVRCFAGLTSITKRPLTHGPNLDGTQATLQGILHDDLTPDRRSSNGRHQMTPDHTERRDVARPFAVWPVPSGPSVRFLVSWGRFYGKLGSWLPQPSGCVPEAKSGRVGVSARPARRPRAQRAANGP
jgi:hypothetical protein